MLRVFLQPGKLRLILFGLFLFVAGVLAGSLLGRNFPAAMPQRTEFGAPASQLARLQAVVDRLIVNLKQHEESSLQPPPRVESGTAIDPAKKVGQAGPSRRPGDEPKQETEGTTTVALTRTEKTKTSALPTHAPFASGNVRLTWESGDEMNKFLIRLCEEGFKRVAPAWMKVGIC